MKPPVENVLRLCARNIRAELEKIGGRDHLLRVARGHILDGVAELEELAASLRREARRARTTAH
jgi:hypothetical protein